jgi:hypothetical protein
MKYKSELALMRSQNVDITKFETQLDEFKTALNAPQGNTPQLAPHPLHHLLRCTAPQSRLGPPLGRVAAALHWSSA